jgi:hypothetical protein
MIDGRTRGLAIKPLGSIDASFYAMGNTANRQGALLFDLAE